MNQKTKQLLAPSSQTGCNQPLPAIFCWGSSLLHLRTLNQQRASHESPRRPPDSETHLWITSTYSPWEGKGSELLLAWSRTKLFPPHTQVLAQLFWPSVWEGWAKVLPSPGSCPPSPGLSLGAEAQASCRTEEGLYPFFLPSLDRWSHKPIKL